MYILIILYICVFFILLLILMWVCGIYIVFIGVESMADYKKMRNNVV